MANAIVMKNPQQALLRRGWVRMAAALVVVASGAYGTYRYRAAATAGALPPGVQVAKVDRLNLDQKVTATGVISAQTGAQVKIGAQLSGRIKRLRADVGQLVKAGDPIAELDLPDLEAQVRQAEDNVAQAKSRYDQAVLNAALTREQTREDVVQSDAAVAAADSRLRSAEAMAKWQPQQTASDIKRANAALATSISNQRQVKASVDLQLNQARANTESERANLANLKRQLARSDALQPRGFVAIEAVEGLRTQVEQAKSRVATAEANEGIVKEKTAADVAAAADAVSQAQANLDAAKSGQSQNEMRVADTENARHAAAQARAQLDQARSNLRQRAIRDQAVVEAAGALKVAQHQLDYQHTQQSRTVIRTPISGTVVSIAAQQGETVAAAFATPTLIVVTDLNRLEVKAYVDETDVGRVHVGLPAEVKVDSDPDRGFKGKVTKIASASTAKDNVVTYETTIALENPEGRLKPDMTASVEIFLKRRPNVLAVPSEAVKQEGEDHVVYVLPSGRGKPDRRRVKTGISDDVNTEITQGLKPGDTVILAGLDKYGVKSFTTRQ